MTDNGLGIVLCLFGLLYILRPFIFRERECISKSLRALDYIYIGLDMSVGLVTFVMGAGLLLVTAAWS